jgi:protein associated with RNAse G/E
MTRGQRIKVNSRKYDDSIRKSWSCELVERTGDLLVLRGIFDIDVSHPGLGEIRRGTISHEYYWFDHWYNIFRFDEPDGVALRNYYCNYAMPPILADDVLDYVDLDIDVIVWPDLSFEVLDRDDFEENAGLYKYTDEIRSRSDQTIAELLQMIQARKFPFHA